MATYQAPQKIFLRFLLSLGVAAGILISLYVFFSGPRLGPHYDYLMRYRPPPPVSRELVIIETDPGGFIEPITASAILMTLIELDARGLAIQAPILGVSKNAGPGGIPAGNELPDRLNEEFSLLARNIRNLFQAIQMGSIAPEEAEQYVGDLIGLSERGKERLLSILNRKDDSGRRLMEKTAAIFGNVWEAGDVRFSAFEPAESGAGSMAVENRCYSRPVPDPDGVFRRMYPLYPGLEQSPDRAEHVVYAMLNRQFGPAEIEYRNGMPLLRFKREGLSRDIPLDSRGAVLIEQPRGDEGFKRLTLKAFEEYEKTDRELALFLDALRERGYFVHLKPEAYPTILYSYSHEILQELLENTEENLLDEQKARWLDARAEYVRSLEDFVTGPSETNLVMNYEERIASKNITNAELRRLVALRNGLINDFTGLREKHGEFIRLRSGLSAAFAGAFCILGPARTPVPANSARAAPGNFLTRFLPRIPPEPIPSDAEASAILGNAILSGRAIIFPPGQFMLFWSLAAVLCVLCITRRLGPAPTLIAGFLLIILIAAVFSCGFIFTQYWFDPLIPAGSAAAGVLVSFFFALRVKRWNEECIQRSYGAAVGPSYLMRLVKAGQPGIRETLQVKAAIVAIRQGDLLAAESREKPPDSAEKIRAFRETAARCFKKAGGTVVGTDGDLILIAFGSPLERTAMRRGKTETPYDDDEQARGSHSPEAKAVGFILDFLAETPEASDWRFGIDAGDCAFGYTELSGYTAFGRPMVRARILSGLTSRYHARILITARVSERIEGFLTRRLDLITDIAGKEKEVFYEVVPLR
jgi:class 3 adenylate cyclase